MRQFSCVTNENTPKEVMRFFQHSVLITSNFLGQSGAKTKIFPRWKLVDFIRRSTIYLQMSSLDTTTALLYVGFEKFF